MKKVFQGDKEQLLADVIKWLSRELVDWEPRELIVEVLDKEHY